MQTQALRRNPATGSRLVDAINAAQFREQNPDLAWLFDPWSGRRRDAAELLSDPRGMHIQPAEQVVASMGEDDPTMSQFATQEDYWRGMSEYLSNEMLKVAVALGVGRTQDIYRQITRIRLAHGSTDNLDGLLESMEAGELLLMGGLVKSRAKVLFDAAEEAEDLLIRSAVEARLGHVPADYRDRVRVLSSAGAAIHLGLDGDYLITAMPPRLQTEDGEQEGAKVFSQVLEHFDMRETLK